MRSRMPGDLNAEAAKPQPLVAADLPPDIEHGPYTGGTRASRSIDRRRGRSPR
jgi:hypothetical protein